jgi:membrane-associated protein
MELETAFSLITQYGYFALFLILWVGFFCIPVPNEVIVMTSGFITSQSYFNEIPALIVTYAGIVMSLTTLYLLGRYFFSPVQKRLIQHPKMEQYLTKASLLIEQYGPLALIVGYFFPGVRHFVPFMIGSNKTKFRRFSLYAFSTAAVWTVLFFLLGFNFGKNMDQIIKFVFYWGLPIIPLVLVFILFRYLRKKKVGKSVEN